MAKVPTPGIKETSPAPLSEETLTKYKEARKKKEKEMRKLRKEEIKNNLTGQRRLAFLLDIFYSMGYKPIQVAKKSGYTQQSMSWHLSVKDDCKLSQAETWLEAIGLKIKVELKPLDPTERIQTKQIPSAGKVKCTIRGDISNDIKNFNVKMPFYINECKPDKRMYFLAQYLPKCGMNITALMQKCKIDLTSLRLIFANDDIKISHIYQVAENTGAEIIWEINKIEEN